MKKNLLFSILGIAMFSAGAQSQNHSFFSKSPLKVTSLRKSSSNLRQDDVIKESLDSILSNYYNPSNNTWTLGSVYIAKYDVKGNNISDQSFDIEDGDRFLSITNDFTYNNNNQLLTETHTEYYEGGVDFIEVKEYTYDLSGNLTTSTLSRTESSALPALESKIEYAYNSGKLISETHSEYTSSSTWKPARKIDYTNNGSGNKILEVVSFWSGTDWYETLKLQHIYNTVGQIVLSVDSAKVGVNQYYTAIHKNEYNYDTYGNQVTQIYSALEENSNTWTNGYKVEVQVDPTTSIDNIVSEASLKEGFINKVTSAKYYGYEAGNWVAINSETPYYSAFNATSVSDIRLDQGNLYYDAATQTLRSVEITGPERASIVLYDLQGKTVATQEMNSLGVSLQQLAPGMYVYHLNHNDAVSAGKFIVK